MKSLFEIENDVLETLNALDEAETANADPDIINAVAADLDIALSDLKAKAPRYVAMIKKFEAEAAEKIAGAAYYAAEVKKLKDAAKAKANKAQRLADRLFDALMLYNEATNEVEIDAGAHSVRLNKKGGKAPFKTLDADLIPLEYYQTIETLKLDKDLLRASLEAGEPVPGAELETGPRYYLKIK